MIDGLSVRRGSTSIAQARHREASPELSRTMIDAQAEVALESVFNGSPPGERLLLLGEHPKTRLSIQRKKIPESLALGAACKEHGLAMPPDRARPHLPARRCIASTASRGLSINSCPSQLRQAASHLSL